MGISMVHGSQPCTLCACSSRLGEHVVSGNYPAKPPRRRRLSNAHGTVIWHNRRLSETLIVGPKVSRHNGSRILGRSFMAAYKQAQAASQYQRAQAKMNGGLGASARASLASGMTLDEACRILNVKPPANGQASVEEVLDRYKRLFDANDPQKGGSFYLQSKIVRAKERFERELGPMREKAEQEAEAKEGWKPKIYKDR